MLATPRDAFRHLERPLRRSRERLGRLEQAFDTRQKMKVARAVARVEVAEAAEARRTAEEFWSLL